MRKKQPFFLLYKCEESEQICAEMSFICYELNFGTNFDIEFN